MFNSVNSNNNTAEFIATCCHFHGCHGHDIVQGSTFCKDNIKEQTLILNGGKYIGEHMSINHYSRSLEKFGEKAKTWTTSGGEVKENENMKDVAKNYDLNKFLQRSVGWKYDGNALRFSCQVREVLQEVTGEKVFFRAGKFRGESYRGGISLYTGTGGVLFYVEWFIRQLWRPSIILYNITSIAYDQYTDIYPLLNINMQERSGIGMRSSGCTSPSQIREVGMGDPILRDFTLLMVTHTFTRERRLMALKATDWLSRKNNGIYAKLALV